MEFFGGLLVLFGGIVFPLVLIVGLVKPSLFKKPDKTPANRKEISIFSVVAGMLCLGIGGAMLPAVEEVPTATVNKPVEQPAVAKSEAKPIADKPVIVEDKAVLEIKKSEKQVSEVPKMDVTPQKIRDHINEIDQEIQRISHFKFDNIAENAKQSRRMIALRDKPMPFGDTMFDEPYGYCGAAETFAVAYWYSMLSGDKNKVANDELTQYKDYKTACLDAVTQVEDEAS